MKKLGLVAWLAGLALISGAVPRCVRAQDAASPAPLVNPFEQPGQWYKANLHTHSTTSDGKLPLAAILGQYRAAGYNIVAITDHEKTNDISGLSADNFLVISGMETHPEWKKGSMPYHMVCLNVPLGFDLKPVRTPGERIAKVKETGGEVFIAHPYWCGMSLEQLNDMRGAVAMEVYNHTCGEYAVSSVHWDQALNADTRLPAVAVDDEHSSASCGGWTMIKAESLSVGAVLDALRRGACYASSGPTIEDFRLVDGKAVIKCSPAAKIRFTATAPNAHRAVAKPDQPLTGAEYALPRGVRYVRAEVIDAEGRTAWSNPLFVEASK